MHVSIITVVITSSLITAISFLVGFLLGHYLNHHNKEEPYKKFVNALKKASQKSK